MNEEQVRASFDAMAEGYDRQWGDNAPINGCLHLLMGAVMGDLPERARILCVGAGTGAEIVYLAKRFAGWTFTAVDPSSGMLEVCRRKMAELGMESRCDYHVGYVDTLPDLGDYDAATSILVSQFISDRALRTEFFRQIALRLKPRGLLISADLSVEVGSDEFDRLLRPWTKLIAADRFSDEKVEGMRQAYTNEVSVLPPSVVEGIIGNGGFVEIVPFFQAAMIHAWFAVKGFL